MSAFAPKLGTNYCPTDNEVHEINVLLAEPSEQLRQLDSKIDDLRKSMEELVVERNRIGEFVNAHKALISPMRRIPIDVLQEIFVACLATEHNCIMSASEAPILLGRICSSWRAISMSTPRIWASLHFVEPDVSFSSSVYVTRARDVRLAQRLETAKSWLGRSGKCPLSISLRINSFGSGYPSANIESWPTYSFLQVMISHSSQWRRIELNMPDGLIRAFRNLTGKDVPLLQSLWLDLHIHHSDPDPLFPPLELLTAPQLVGLHITGFLTQPDVMGLPYEQLTSLLLGPFPSQFDLETSLSLIPKCRQLRRFNVTVYGSENAHGIDGIHIESHTLEVLVVNYYRRRGTTTTPLRALNYLSLPALLHLSVIGDGISADGMVSPSFERFFSISTRLRSLCVYTAFLEKAMFMLMVRALPPSLQRLAIHCDHDLSWSIDDDFIASITPTTHAATACPGLEDLVVRDCHDISDRALLEFIRAKITPGLHSPLKRVRIKLERPMEFDILPEVKSFSKAGFDVVVDYLHPIVFLATGVDPSRSAAAHDWYTGDV
ncbi:hypothetical protein C8F01DRAFT_1368941 [Mycena amicta]|nr:hypothetical protein C8F01DRAFT_1368941 [Mycena amicta]